MTTSPPPEVSPTPRPPAPTSQAAVTADPAAAWAAIQALTTTVRDLGAVVASLQQQTADLTRAQAQLRSQPAVPTLGQPNTLATLREPTASRSKNITGRTLAAANRADSGAALPELTGPLSQPQGRQHQVAGPLNPVAEAPSQKATSEGEPGTSQRTAPSAHLNTPSPTASPRANEAPEGIRHLSQATYAAMAAAAAAPKPLAPHMARRQALQKASHRRPADLTAAERALILSQGQRAQAYAFYLRVDPVPTENHGLRVIRMRMFLRVSGILPLIINWAPADGTTIECWALRTQQEAIEATMSLNQLTTKTFECSLPEAGAANYQRCRRAMVTRRGRLLWRARTPAFKEALVANLTPDLVAAITEERRRLAREDQETRTYARLKQRVQSALTQQQQQPATNGPQPRTRRGRRGHAPTPASVRPASVASVPHGEAMDLETLSPPPTTDVVMTASEPAATASEPAAQTQESDAPDV